jgi:tetratricopeptide (TPR) repeat protein
MLARFGGTTDPRIAERTAKSCLLLPVERADLAVANQFADRAVSVGANDASLVYYQFVKCLAEYRLGQFTNSVEWARKTLTQAGGISELYVQASSVLAMALHQLKQFDEARATMSKGVEFAKTELPSLDGPDLGDRWHDILIAHILLGEAQTLIEDGQVRGKEIK